MSLFLVLWSKKKCNAMQYYTIQIGVHLEVIKLRWLANPPRTGKLQLEARALRYQVFIGIRELFPRSTIHSHATSSLCSFWC